MAKLKGLAGAPKIDYWSEDIDAEHVAFHAGRLRWPVPGFSVYEIVPRAIADWNKRLAVDLDAVVSAQNRLASQLRRREYALIHLYGPREWVRAMRHLDVVDKAVAWMDGGGGTGSADLLPTLDEMEEA